MDFLLTTLKQNLKKVGHIDDDAIQPIAGISNLIEDDLCHDFESKCFSLQKKYQKWCCYSSNRLIGSHYHIYYYDWLLVKHLSHSWWCIQKRTSKNGMCLFSRHYFWNLATLFLASFETAFCVCFYFILFNSMPRSGCSALHWVNLNEKTSSFLTKN